MKGQTLLEVIVTSAVGILVVSALTFAVIFSLRNASFAKNQAQATKLAQEGLEIVRSLRDRDGAILYIVDPRPPPVQVDKFSGLWGISFSCPATCYFYFFSGILTGGTASNSETVSGNFQRQFQIEEEGSDPSAQKKVTAVVRWSDFAGEHQSKLTTVLRNTGL